MHGRIGRGGQGAVYEVWDQDLSRRLAMKVVLGKDEGRASTDTPPVDPETLSRFLEEAQITSQLDHPGVVPVHELGLDAEGHVYFTMRLVRGEDLHRIITKVHAGLEGWSEHRALLALLRACEAIAYAHAKRVIHRDLKPSNLMVGRYGEVYVMDWGLARVQGERDRHDLRIRSAAPLTSSIRTDRRASREEDLDSPLETMDGRVLGTPSYMPPEQAAGRIEEMGPASDVYSMGAVLYQLLTGRIPYVPPDGRISARTVLARVLDGPPTRVAELAPRAPVELVAICERAMARSIEDRYPDMEALANDLRAFLDRRVVAAYESGAWAELKKWVVRNRGWAATGAAALALLVAALGWAMVERERAGAAALRAMDARAAAVAEKERVLRLSDVKLVSDLAAESTTLWPAHPHRVADMERWLVRARELHARLPLHEASLTRVRALAPPLSPAEAEDQRRSHPKHPELVTEKGRLGWIRALEQAIGSGSPPPLPSLAGEELPASANDLNELAWPLVDPDRLDFGGEPRGGAIAELLAGLDPPGAGDWDTVAWARFANARFDAAVSAMETAVSRAVGPDERQEFEAAQASLLSSIAEFRGDGARERLAARIAEVEDRVLRLEAEVGERHRFEFPENEADLAWQHQVLMELVAGLSRFGGPEGTIGELEERLQSARTIVERTVTGPEAASAWAAAIASIASRDECPRYDGLVIRPQLGLLPLDRNPLTGLWEFWHPQSGERPLPNADVDPMTPWKCNRWVITGRTGLVFVLIPGGTFRMGAERPSIGVTTRETPEGLLVSEVEPGSLASRAGVAIDDRLLSIGGAPTRTAIELTRSLALLRTGEQVEFIVSRTGEELALRAVVERGVGSPNIDPWARPLEWPVIDVTLRPYFLSKYEWTQGQWDRSPASLKRASYYGTGHVAEGVVVDDSHPVENVSWEMCVDALEKSGLALPTEAQWEMGCRGGTASVFWSGDRTEDLSGVGNIADRTAKRASPSWSATMELDDGVVCHAPVGTFRPNGFGLHEVHGSVWEWCRDTLDRGPADVSGPDGLARDDPRAADRALRGGCFALPVGFARSALRFADDTEARLDTVGARPVRAVSDEYWAPVVRDP